jgi:AraC-like DNA-binding protein
MTKPTISVLVLRHVANCLDLAGCNPGPLLVPFGLRPGDLDDPKAVMPLEDYLAFFETAAIRAGNSTFGLQVGRLAASDSLGALGFLFHSAPTFRAALTGFSAYLATLQQATANRLTTRGGIASFEYSISDQSLQKRRQDAEFSIAVMHNFCRSYCGPDFELTEVRFEHAQGGQGRGEQGRGEQGRGGDARAYRDFFRCEVSFDSDTNCLSFEDRFLDRRGGVIDPALFPIIEEYLTRRAADGAREEGSPKGLIRALEASPLDAAPTLSEAAAALGISVATLNRRLRAEGVSWRAMVQERRMNAAARLLQQSRRDIAEIALAVGFSESASFVRSVHRHFGTTPKKFRDRRAGGD